MDTNVPSTSEQPETRDLSTLDELQGEIVKGDLDCDGRVIIYVIKGYFQIFETVFYRLIGGFLFKRTRLRT